MGVINSVKYFLNSNTMKLPITKEKYDAVLFDLDGVLTPTEKIHSACWKVMFDSFLKKYCSKNNLEFQPFNIDNDYLKYVDGKPRYKGVEDFLSSRNIYIPYGTPDSPSSELSVCGLGNKKNELFNLKISTDNVEVYEGSLRLLKYLHEKDFHMAVVSSSKNCNKILSSAELADYFEFTVDGIYAENHDLKGKPEPETFLEACKLLKTEPKRTVVIEDASSGIHAGKQGKFGLVIGVARKNNENELYRNGADIVVGDLGEFLV